jgi:hypothetical protein
MSTLVTHKHTILMGSLVLGQSSLIDKLLFANRTDKGRILQTHRVLMTDQFLARFKYHAATLAFIVLQVELIVRWLFRSFFRSLSGVGIALMFQNELLEHVNLLALEAGKQFAHLVVVIQFEMVVEGQKLFER